MLQYRDIVMAKNVFREGAQQALNPVRPDVAALVAPVQQWVSGVRSFSSQYDNDG